MLTSVQMDVLLSFRHRKTTAHSLSSSFIIIVKPTYAVSSTAKTAGTPERS